MTNVETTRLVKFYLTADRGDIFASWGLVNLVAEVLLSDDNGMAYKALIRFGAVGKIFSDWAELELDNVLGLACGRLSRVTPNGEQCFNTKRANGAKVSSLAEATSLRLGLWASRTRLPNGAENVILERTGEWNQAATPVLTRKGTMPFMWATFRVKPGETLDLEEFGWLPVDPSRVIREAL